MRKKTSTSLLLGLLAASLVATPCYASATQKKITETQNAQQENQKKLSDAQGRINSLEAKKGDLEGYLKELNQQLSELGENLQDIQNQSQEKQETLDKLEVELEAAKEKEADQYKDMKLRIQYMYENAEDSYVMMLLSAKDLTDFLSQAENMSKITEYDRNMLEEYKATTAEIQDKEESIRKEQEKLKELEKESLEKQDEINTVMESTYVQVKDYENQISAEQSNANTLLSQIASQTDTINSLIKQQKDEEAAAILAQQQAQSSASNTGSSQNSQSQAGQAPSAPSQSTGNSQSQGSTSQGGSNSGSQESSPSHDNSGKKYLGRFTLTGYCPCVQCCGKADGITASGTTASAGRTVAMGGVPFGTKLLINGNVYTVEDRGTAYGHVDIFFNTHAEALQFGRGSADVYQIN